MRRQRLIGIVFVVIISVIVLLIGSLRPSGSPTATAHDNSLVNNQQPSDLGIPAIPVPPAVSVDRVQSYVVQHPVWHNTASAQDTNNVMVQQIPFQQALVDIGRSGLHTNIPDSTPVFFATFTGSFIFPGPPGVAAQYDHGFEVFDASTGNLLLAGGY